jgi:hypothetical protein
VAAHTSRPRRWPGGRRFVVSGAVGVLVLALVGVTAALLGSGGAGAGAGAAQGLSSRTLLRLPAASAVASGDGAGFVTDDQRDVVERFDPATRSVEAATHLSGRPVAMVLHGADLFIAEMVTNTVLEVTASSLKVVRGWRCRRDRRVWRCSARTCGFRR